jgi:hypothetical protein
MFWVPTGLNSASTDCEKVADLRNLLVIWITGNRAIFPHQDEQRLWTFTLLTFRTNPKYKYFLKFSLRVLTLELIYSYNFFLGSTHVNSFNLISQCQLAVQPSSCWLLAVVVRSLTKVGNTKEKSQRISEFRTNIPTWSRWIIQFRSSATAWMPSQ